MADLPIWRLAIAISIDVVVLPSSATEEVNMMTFGGASTLENSMLVRKLRIDSANDDLGLLRKFSTTVRLRTRFPIAGIIPSTV